MNISSLVGHVTELAELLHTSELQTDGKLHKPADRLVSEFFRERGYLGAKDRRFISGAIFGLVRFRRRLQVLIEQFAKENNEATTLLEAGFIKWLPMYIAYSIAVEEKDPKDVAASLDSRWRPFFPSIELAHIAEWLAHNRSLDFLQGSDVEQLAVWYSFPDWMVQTWHDELGTGETEELINALNTEAGVILRVNTLKTTRDECQARLLSEGIPTTPTRYSPVGLLATKRFSLQSSPTFRDGWYEIQDEGSQIIALLADPKPGMTVIDACAGAGGKSLMMAQQMANEGEIFAWDVEERRLRNLIDRSNRCEATIISSALYSSIQPDDYLNRADIVLVDAPCSGTGTSRRNPGLKWTVTESQVENFAAIQKDILERHAPFVKVGGRLIYATCSLLSQENERVLEWFTATHTNFQLTPPEQTLASLGLDGAVSGSAVKLFPHRHGTDGFFIATLQRTA